MSDAIRFGKYAEAIDLLEAEKKKIEKSLSKANLEKILESVLEDSFIRITRSQNAVDTCKQFGSLSARSSMLKVFVFCFAGRFGLELHVVVGHFCCVLVCEAP